MDVISEYYRHQLRQIHDNRPWGRAAEMCFEEICRFIDKYPAKSVLDYGAGRRYLEQHLPLKYPGLEIRSYDPGVPDISHTPGPCDLTLCIDVLEHVEPDLLENVLEDLARVTVKYALLHVATRPAGLILPDGRNAHLIVESHDWWLDRISQNFLVISHKKNKDALNSKFEVSRKPT